jgi:hypothetical protein
MSYMELEQKAISLERPLKALDIMEKRCIQDLLRKP